MLTFQTLTKLHPELQQADPNAVADRVYNGLYADRYDPDQFRETFLNGNAPVTHEDITGLYPQLSEADPDAVFERVAAGLYGVDPASEDATPLRAIYKGEVDTERSWPEVATDTGRSFASGSNSMAAGIAESADLSLDPTGLSTTAATAAGLAANAGFEGVAEGIVKLDAGRRGLLRRATDTLSDYADRWSDGKSDAIKQESALSQQAQQERVLEGDNIAERFAGATTDMLTNPSLALDMAATSLPYMLPGAAAAKAAGAPGVVASSGMIGGSSASLETKERVRSMDYEVLYEQSDEFRGMVDDGVHPQIAREIAADQAGTEAFVVAGSLSAFAAGLTARYESAMFRGRPTRTKIMGAAAREYGEEFIQEGSEALASNIGVSRYADRDQELTEGVVEQAAQGALLGPAQAGAFSGVNYLQQWRSGNLPVIRAADNVLMKAREAEPLTEDEIAQARAVYPDVDDSFFAGAREARDERDLLNAQDNLSSVDDDTDFSFIDTPQPGDPGFDGPVTPGQRLRSIDDLPQPSEREQPITPEQASERVAQAKAQAEAPITVNQIRDLILFNADENEGQMTPAELEFVQSVEAMPEEERQTPFTFTEQQSNGLLNPNTSRVIPANTPAGLVRVRVQQEIENRAQRPQPTEESEAAPLVQSTAGPVSPADVAPKAVGFRTRDEAQLAARQRDGRWKPEKDTTSNRWVLKKQPDLPPAPPSQVTEQIDVEDAIASSPTPVDTDPAQPSLFSEDQPAAPAIEREGVLPTAAPRTPTADPIPTRAQQLQQREAQNKARVETAQKFVKDNAPRIQAWWEKATPEQRAELLTDKQLGAKKLSDYTEAQQQRYLKTKKVNMLPRTLVDPTNLGQYALDNQGTEAAIDIDPAAAQAEQAPAQAEQAPAQDEQAPAQAEQAPAQAEQAQAQDEQADAQDEQAPSRVMRAKDTNDTRTPDMIGAVPNALGLVSQLEQRARMTTKVQGWNKPSKKNPNSLAPGKDIVQVLESELKNKRERQEIQWSGLLDYLTLDPGARFSRQDVVSYLTDNMVEVVETIGYPDPDDPERDPQDTDGTSLVFSDPETDDAAFERAADEAFDAVARWKEDSNSEPTLEDQFQMALKDDTEGAFASLESEYADDLDMDEMSGVFMDPETGVFELEDEADFYQDELSSETEAVEMLRLTEWAANIVEEAAREEALSRIEDDPPMIAYGYVGEGSTQYTAAGDSSGWEIQDSYGETVATGASLDAAIEEAEDYLTTLGVIRNFGPQDSRWGATGYNTPGDYDNYREYKIQLPKVPGNYIHELHFPIDDNVITFLRVNDRVLDINDEDGGVDGKEAFFVEEQQSDWHQNGREAGYYDPSKGEVPKTAESRAVNDAIEAEKKALDATQEFLEFLADDANEETAGRASELLTKEAVEEWAENLKTAAVKKLRGITDTQTGTDPENISLIRAMLGADPKGEKLLDAALKAKRYHLSLAAKAGKAYLKSAPIAPFSDEAWMNLGMKRALLDAIANPSYEVFAWADAENLIARWSSKYAQLYYNLYNRGLPKTIKELTGITPIHQPDGDGTGFWYIPITQELRDTMQSQPQWLFERSQNKGTPVVSKKVATAQLRSNPITRAAMNKKTLMVMTNDELAEAMEADSDLVPIYFEGETVGAYNTGTFTAMVLSDRLSSPEQAVPVALHELLHDAQNYADMTGKERFSMLVGKPLQAITERLQELRDSGTAEEQAILTRAFDAYEASGSNELETEDANRELAAYALGEIAASRQVPRSLMQWAKDLMAALAEGLNKLLGTKITPQNMTLKQFADLSMAAVEARNAPRDSSAAGVEFDKRFEFAGSEKGKRQLMRAQAGRPLNTSPVTAVDDLTLMERVVARAPQLMWIAGRRQLAEVAPKGMTAIADFVRTAEQMDADRNDLLSRAGTIINNWHEWARKNKTASRALDEIMHLSTIAGYDPSEAYSPILTEKDYMDQRSKLNKRVRATNNPQDKSILQGKLKDLEQLREEEKARKAAKPMLDVKYKALTKEAKGFYAEIRDAYTKDSNRLYSELKKRMERMEMSDSVRMQMIDKLRLNFEYNKVRGPYFPLARFGNYWAVAKDSATGETVEYRHYDSPKDARVWVADMKKKGYRVATGTKSKDQHVWDHVDPNFAATVTELVKGADDIARAQRMELADNIWQLYLNTMPEMSVRKKFIHRKKTAGWNEDALRAFSSQAMHTAHHITKIRHGDTLASHVNEARQQAASMENSQFADVLVNELNAAQDWAMNPTNNSVAQALTSFGFLSYLSVSPAAAMVNMVQTPMVAGPILGAKFGYGKASAELARASKEFAGLTGENMKRRVKNKKLFMSQTMKKHYDDILKGDEKAAYDELVRRGRFDKTLSHDLAGVAEEGLDRNMNVRMWMDRVAASFHNAEVFNREVTGMAAYRLARKAGQGHEKAIDAADTIVQDAHFDYSNSARARFMRPPAMKVIAQFKQYSLNMSWRLLRDAYVATGHGDVDPETRKEVRKQALGMWGTALFFSGLAGAPAYSAISVMVGMLHDMFGDDDEPFDFEADMRSGLKSLVGEDMADIIWKGPVDFVTQASVGSRVAPDIYRMWIQESGRDYAGREKWANVLIQAAGPVVGGTGAMLVEGWDLATKEDEQWRAIEKMLPKFARDLLKATRFANEGVTNMKGDPILPKGELDTWELTLQAMGFVPAKLSKQYELNNKVKQRETRITNRKKRINGQVWKLISQGKPMTKELRDTIRAFNRANPETPITGKTLQSSMRSRFQSSQTSTAGINITDPELRERLLREIDF